jgi:hypothetical protein
MRLIAAQIVEIRPFFLIRVLAQSLLKSSYKGVEDSPKHYPIPHERIDAREPAKQSPVTRSTLEHLDACAVRLLNVGQPNEFQSFALGRHEKIASFGEPLTTFSEPSGTKQSKPKH